MGSLTQVRMSSSMSLAMSHWPVRIFSQRAREGLSVSQGIPTRPAGSTAVRTPFPTYRYKFPSPAANPIGSSLGHLPTGGSYQRWRLFCKPVSASNGRPVKRKSESTPPPAHADSSSSAQSRHPICDYPLAHRVHSNRPSCATASGHGATPRSHAPPPRRNCQQQMQLWSLATPVCRLRTMGISPAVARLRKTTMLILVPSVDQLRTPRCPPLREPHSGTLPGIAPRKNVSDRTAQQHLDNPRG